MGRDLMIIERGNQLGSGYFEEGLQLLLQLVFALLGEGHLAFELVGEEDDVLGDLGNAGNGLLLGFVLLLSGKGFLCWFLFCFWFGGFLRFGGCLQFLIRN
jgi:hypothetical protein